VTAAETIPSSPSAPASCSWVVEVTFVSDEGFIKRPTTVSKETYYSVKRDLLSVVVGSVPSLRLRVVGFGV
jgi:hypothetical protein